MGPPAKERPFDPEFGHEGWYEDRDPQGCEIHWTWLRAHWNHQADLIEAAEKRQRAQRQ